MFYGMPVRGTELEVIPCLLVQQVLQQRICSAS